MKIKIDRDGKLAIDRNGKMIAAVCPYNSKQCGHFCIAFREPMERTALSSAYLQLCQAVGTIYFSEIIDERQKPNEE